MGASSARAQVIETVDGLTLKNAYDLSTASVNTVLHETCHLRVVPDNGQPEFEAQLSLWGKGVDPSLKFGKWTYVRYDPDIPDRCDMDKERLAREFGYLHNGQPVVVPTDVSDFWFKDSASSDVPAPPKSALTPEGMVGYLAHLEDLHSAGTLTDTELAAAKARLPAPGQPE